MKPPCCWRWIGASCLLLFGLWACAELVPVKTEPPAFPGGFLGAAWGSSVEEADKAMTRDGFQKFEDRFEQGAYVVYASGTYLGSPAIFSYFFTPKTRRLFKVDATLREPKVYDQAKAELTGKFGPPTFAGQDVTHWSAWSNMSLIIVQRDSTNVQISYGSGPWMTERLKEQ